LSEALALARDNIEWGIVMSLYHSGPLSLLIGTGLIGLIIGFALLVVAWTHHAKRSVEPWQDALLRRLHLVVFVVYTVQVAVFFLIYGDVQRSFPDLLLYLAVMEGLVYTERRLRRKAVAPETVPDTPGPQLIPTRRGAETPPSGGVVEEGFRPRPWVP
jgi:hypothetical protein